MKTILLNLRICNSLVFKPIVMADKSDWFYVIRLTLLSSSSDLSRDHLIKLCMTAKLTLIPGLQLKFSRWMMPNIPEHCPFYSQSKETSTVHFLTYGRMQPKVTWQPPVLGLIVKKTITDVRLWKFKSQRSTASCSSTTLRKKVAS